MRYATIEQGRAASGLRLVLTAGVAAPWSEAAKAIFAVKGLPYLAVAQDPGGENPELVAWTGQAAAPVAVHDGGRPYADSLDILFLAERLAPEPRLIPECGEARLLALGLSREVVGRLGVGWNRRLMIQAGDVAVGTSTERGRRLMARHDFHLGEAQRAERCLDATLRYMASVLHAQRRRGSRYFVGTQLSCADLYWAVFSIMFKPLPKPQCAMTDEKRARFENIGPVLAEALDPILLEHRAYIFKEFIGLPMDFLPEE